jgi:hypothetical protein
VKYNLLTFEIVSFGFAKIIFWVSLRNLIIILNDWSSPSIDPLDGGIELIVDTGICSGRNSSTSLDL